MGASQKSAGMARSAVIRTIDWERLRKVPDLHPFEKVHHSKQTVQIPLFAIASPPPPLAVAAKAAPAACGKNRGKSSGRRSNRSRRSKEAEEAGKQKRQKNSSSTVAAVAAAVVAVAVAAAVIAVGVAVESQMQPFRTK